MSTQTPRSDALKELYKGKVWMDRAIFYICYGTACSLPTQDYGEALRALEDLRSQLKGSGTAKPF
jgi:hypothetical protein